MSDMTFNTKPGEVVDRCLLVLCLNTGETSTPAWSPVGKRVEESSMEFDWGEESKTDIFGQTYTTMKKPVITQTFEPCELDADDAAQRKIWNLAIREQDVLPPLGGDTDRGVPGSAGAVLLVFGRQRGGGLSGPPGSPAHGLGAGLPPHRGSGEPGAGARGTGRLLPLVDLPLRLL